MSVLASFNKKDEVYGFKTLYREIGYFISRLEQYERSLRFFDEAIKKNPDDRRALMGRASARSKACKYEGALEDIRRALKLDPDDLVMLAHKALNTYLNCEFEDGLVQNTRLMPKRKKPEYFQLGAMHCANAIENCLGERTGRPLRDHYLIIRRIAWKRNFDEQRGFQPRSRHYKKKTKAVKKERPQKNSLRMSMLDEDAALTGQEPPQKEESVTDTIYSQSSAVYAKPPHQTFPYRPLQRHTTNISNYMAEKYLDTMYKDKIFLKEMPFLAGIECPNKEGTEQLIKLAKSGYKTVKYKQELLRARRPFYFIKYQEVHSSGGLKLRQESQFIQLKEKTKRDADVILNKMVEAVQEKKWKIVLETSEKLKEYCDARSRKVLPDRKEYLEAIYENVCQAHFDLKRLNKNQYEWDVRKRIFKLLGMPLSREASTDSVIYQMKSLFVNLKKQIRMFAERLRKASSSQELCWVYHELSRYHYDSKHLDLSMLYAKKCQGEALKIGDIKWLVNALFLIIRIHVAQHCKNDAKAVATTTINVAKKMGDTPLVEFLQKCREVIDNLDIDEDDTAILQEREQKILHMMTGDKMKEEASHLFKMMQAMPAARRMSVMPGVKVAEDGTESIRMTRPSIMPAIGSKADTLSSTTGSGAVKKKGGASGVEIAALLGGLQNN